MQVPRQLIYLGIGTQMQSCIVIVHLCVHQQFFCFRVASAPPKLKRHIATYSSTDAYYPNYQRQATTQLGPISICSSHSCLQPPSHALAFFAFFGFSVLNRFRSMQLCIPTRTPRGVSMSVMAALILVLSACSHSFVHSLLPLFLSRAAKEEVRTAEDHCRTIGWTLVNWSSKVPI
jgi:hypothetical protein